MTKITLTKSIIETWQTKRGGYRRDFIEAIGESWPPKKGWKRRAIGRQVDIEKLPRQHYNDPVY